MQDFEAPDVVLEEEGQGTEVGVGPDAAASDRIVLRGGRVAMRTTQLDAFG